MYRAPSMPDSTPDVVKTRRPPRRSSARLRTLSRRVLLIFRLIEPLRAADGRRRIRTGQIEVNGGAFNPSAPFGGYKNSGYGREYGEHGFEEFLEIKSMQL